MISEHSKLQALLCHISMTTSASKMQKLGADDGLEETGKFSFRSMGGKMTKLSLVLFIGSNSGSTV